MTLSGKTYRLEPKAFFFFFCRLVTFLYNKLKEYKNFIQSLPKNHVS